MANHKDANRRRSIKRVLKSGVFLIFLATLLLSSTMAIKIVIEGSKAKNDYSELRAFLRQKNGENADNNAEPDIITSEKNPTATEKLSIAVQQPKISMDFSALKEINPDIIGWIRADGTNIDYPIAQTDNNEYYLSHLYNKEWNSSGTIFADYRNADNFSNRNTVLYGHHMKNGTMFHALEEYKDQSFFEVNPTMTLFTPDGDYIVELISGTVEDGSSQFVKFDFDDDENFIKYIENFRFRSTFVSDVEIRPGDRIVSLCTCSYERTNARYMIIGRLVPVMETVN